MTIYKGFFKSKHTCAEHVLKQVCYLKHIYTLMGAMDALENSNSTHKTTTKN